MFEISDPYFVSVVMFFALLGIVIYRDRKNVEFHTVVIMRRTERFRGFIEWVANLSPRFWRAAGTLGVLMAAYVMVYGSYLLLKTTGMIITKAITQPALQLVLPSPSATAAAGPGYFLIPFWFWIIAIASILVPHEMMHGIIARAEKIRLRSVGLLLLVIFPGAFVEPDEKQLQKSKLLTRLRVFAAGSFANFSIALLIIGLMMYVAWPLAAGTGVTIETVAYGSPAALAGLSPGQVITSINGNSVTATYSEYASGLGYFYQEVGTISAGQELKLVVDGKNYVIDAVANPDTGQPYIGITYTPIMKVPFKSFITVVNLLMLIAQFSLAVGMVNILPIYPLDGGLMLDAVVKKYVKGRRAQTLIHVVAYFLIIVLIFDFIGPWIVGLF
jgi:membrane-associated protease RseP (regulator of RpoE activity)